MFELCEFFVTGFLPNLVKCEAFFVCLSVVSVFGVFALIKMLIMGSAK